MVCFFRKTLAYKKMNDILNNSRYRCERKENYKETMTHYAKEVINDSPFFYAEKSPTLDEKIVETRKETEGKLLKYVSPFIANLANFGKSKNSSQVNFKLEL